MFETLSRFWAWFVSVILFGPMFGTYIWAKHLQKKQKLNEFFKMEN